jgi:hypothetical protein
MALTWVKAGACGNETSIEAGKLDATHVKFEITTTCEHIQGLADALGPVDVAHEMACRLDETQVYRLAAEHVCRNSCIVPAAIMKTMEVTAGIFLPGDCSITFVEGVI